MKRKQKQFCAALAAAMCVLAACADAAPQETEPAPKAESADMTADQLAPEAETPETAGIGEVYFLPFQQEVWLGTNMLSVCARKSGLAAGSGTLSLCREDGTLVEEAAFDSRAELGPLEEADKTYVGWTGGGTRATIVLENPLTEKGNYYVTMTENCLLDPETGLGSRALEKGRWSFSVAGYGIAGGTLLNQEVWAVGETVTLDVRLGDGAAKAVVSGFDPEMAEPSAAELTEDGTLSVRLKKAGTAQWNLLFLDSSGKTLNGTGIAVQAE